MNDVPSAMASDAGATEPRREFGGAIAALLALFLDLLWRATLAPTGVASIPEAVVAAVARLTPTALFGWATENLGSLAQNTLFAVAIVGIVVVGNAAGRGAATWIAADRFGAGTGGRVAAAALMGTMLFLAIVAVVYPLAREGFFAAASSRQAALVIQAALFAAVWAVGWLALSAGARHAEPHSAAAETLTRRNALRGVLGTGLAAGVAVLGWRLAKSPERGNVAAQSQAAADIASRARLAAPDVSQLPPDGGVDAPGVSAVAALQDDNPEAAFDALVAEGKLTPVITSVADFYHVSKNISDPVVDAVGWSLKIEGMVGKPLSFSYDEILARATSANITTLACISNELNGDLAGTAEWTGLPLRSLLEEAEVDPATVDIVFYAADGYDDSIPLAQAMHPTSMLVTGMNGEPLPPDHGYPARLIVPPIYGMKNVKWVERIEAVDYDYQGYWQTRGWSDPAPYQIWGRIDTPASGDEIAAGDAVAAGVASAGDRGIFRVEISLDEGATWADATLEPSINPDFTWVRWVFPFTAASGTMKMLMRATDGEGNVAPEEQRPPLPDGATGWPQRTFRVAEGG